MNNQIAHNKLKALANLLLERELYKEADSVSLLAEEVGPYGLTKEADFGTVSVPVAIGIATALSAAGVTWKMSDDGMSILNHLTDDFGAEDAKELYQEWYDYLKGEDLVDGWGTFPVDHAMGGTFMREFIGEKWNAQERLTESEFEKAFEKYYGESAAGIVQFGIDNEDGWIDSYNKILELNQAQKTVEKKEESTVEKKEKDKPTSTPTPKPSTSSKPYEHVEHTRWKDDDEKEKSKPTSESTSAPARSTPPITVTEGDTENIKKIQLALIAEGFSLPRYGADGDFGKETKNALEAYKKREAIAGNFYESIDGELTSTVVKMLLG